MRGKKIYISRASLPPACFRFSASLQERLGGFSACLQGRPDRFSAAGLQGWMAFQQLAFKAGPLFISWPSRLDGFTCVSDSFTMSRSLLCPIWLLGWCLVRSVGCKVGLHPVLEPKTEGRQGRRFTKPPPMPQKGLVRHVRVDWLQWRLNAAISHEVLNVFIPGLDVSARQTPGRIKLASAGTLLLSVGIN